MSFNPFFKQEHFRWGIAIRIGAIDGAPIRRVLTFTKYQLGSEWNLDAGRKSEC